MSAKNVTIEAAGNEYLAHLQARGLETNSIRNRAITIRQFAESSSSKVVRNVRGLDIDQFRSAYIWAPSTANFKMAILRAFLRWCAARGYVSSLSDPMAGWRSQRVPQKDRVRIPQSEWSDLLDSAPHPLERVFAACGLYTMARASELTALRLRDVDLAKGEIKLYRRKTGRYDTMPICQELDTELRRWLRWYHAHCPALPAESYLLPTRPRGACRDNQGYLQVTDDSPVDPTRPMTRPSRNMQRLLAANGYPTRQEGGHTLRRSAARAYYDELVDTGHDGALRQVQTMLDHTNAMTTEVYLGTTRDKAERDRALRGRPMFPVRTPAPNVVRLHG